MRAQAISTDEAPVPRASYSQGLRRGDFLFLSGQVGTDALTGQLVSDSVEGQTVQALRNLGHVLVAAGASWGDVVSVRVYLTDPADYAQMNECYNAAVSEPFPVRTTIYCGLNPGIKVELDAIALLDRGTDSTS
jgi:2-iminobutanoate/2-iminopropanoate deaminase